MRITRDYGLTSSKLEHDLLASIDRSMRADVRKRRKKAPVPTGTLVLLKAHYRASSLGKRRIL